MSMNSSKPYLIRALYQWIVDNDCTPHVMVNALAEGVEVPQQYVKDGQIVLNIAPSAIVNLSMENDFLSFNGRFGGVPTDIFLPVPAIMGIYARENGQGMMFEPEDLPPEPPSPEEKLRAKPKAVESAPDSKANKPGLRVIK